nr:hypothetical protein CFP56_16859 [Quercus suber]
MLATLPPLAPKPKCSICHAFPRPDASCPQPLPVDPEQIWNRDQHDRTEREDAQPPADAEVAQHGRDKERKGAGEGAAQEGVGGNGAGGVALKGVDEVVERGLEDGEEAEAHEGDGDAGHEPEDRRRARPREHEEARDEDDAAEHHGRQARLGHRPAAVGLPARDVEALVQQVAGGAERDAEQHGEEGQRAHQPVPAALRLEDERDRAQARVQDAVDEGGVQRDEEADRRGEELERAHEVLLAELAERDVPFFVFGVQRPVAGFVAQATRFDDEERGGVAFVEDEDVEEEDERLEDAGDVLGPSPAQIRVADGAANDRPKL